MPTFRTELPPLQFPFQISHADALLSIGSCFTENIGKRLSTLKFNHLINPFGIVYNPVSMAEQLEWLLSKNEYSDSDLFENQGLWHSWLHHGSFSELDKFTAIKKMNQSLQQAKQQFTNISRLLITLGTANVFVYKKTEKIVANCHKMPGQVFEKRRLTVAEIVESLLPILQKINAQHPDLQIIFTVSPVRHIRDGLVENQKSKATLLLAIDQICQELQFAHYFPAYELILDDLRDYRFFESDMIHPNETAIEYVWERFREAFFSMETKQLITKIEGIVQASRHRAFHPQSEQYQAFAQKQLDKINQLEQVYTFLNFSDERQLFLQQL